jgi:acetyl esterase
MGLDRQARMVLDEMAKAGSPPIGSMEPAEARKAYVRSRAKFRGKKEEVAGVEDRLIPGPAGQIPVRIYSPAGTAPFPVLIYFHGGGWVVGDLETVDSVCRSLAKQTGCLVMSVDYRLAPEHRFPAAVDDAYAAALWSAQHAAEIGADASRIAVGGDSAGGNLAAVVALMARDRGTPALVYQLLIYPVTNHSFDTESYRSINEGLTQNTMAWYWEQYLRSPDDGKNPYASPLQADDLSNLPPAMVITAEYDPLRDEGEAYADRLQAAGVKVKKKRYDGMIHGFVGMAGALDQGKTALAEAAAELRQVFFNEQA